MTIDALVALVSSLKGARAIGDLAYWEQVVPKIAPLVIDEISNAYDFSFTLADYSTVVTVANQAEYSLSGVNGDLRDVINIRYGTDLRPLTRLRTLDADDLLYDSTITDVWYWYSFDTDNDGNMVATLVATPTVAGTALHIRYRKKDIPLTEFPDGFGFVLARGILGWLDPEKQFTYDRALKGMIERYRVGGKDAQPAPIDPHLALGNRQISDLYGSG